MAPYNYGMNVLADLPLIELQRGRFRVLIYDPRANPLALGARYCHGIYIAELYYGDRLLTSAPRNTFEPYFGGGIPDVFEWPLGFSSAEIGEHYLRIGCARQHKKAHHQITDGIPDHPVHWHIDQQDHQQLAMSCVDRVVQAEGTYGYHLARKIRMTDDGFRITTSLRLDVDWNHPIAWFAHPFFAQTTGGATGFEIPEGSQPDEPLILDQKGLLRLPAEGGLGNVTGLWGNTGGVCCHLDPELGGGLMRITLDRPLDHLVVYALPHVASPEPQLARSWKDDELASWTVSYQWSEK